MPALALTDHGTMFGVIDFYNEAKAAGVKPIIGLETYLAPKGMAVREAGTDKRSIHLLLLAENQQGYQNLLQIASAAQLQGFYYYPRIDHQFLRQHSEGLICTTGCMASEIPRLLQDGNLDEVRRKLDFYFEVFGPDRYFFELQQHEIPELLVINRQLRELGKRYQARYIATNDVHYIEPEDAALQDVMLAIQTGSVLSDPARMRMSDGTYYLRSPQEMNQVFREVPEALSNTLEIAERCNVDLSFKGYHLPYFDVPEGFSNASYLRQLCGEGMRQRYGEHASDEQLQKRLEYELDVIHRMGFDAYFLIVWDLCRYARERGIWYNARGSAAGSIVAYALEITLVDPLEFGLIFERFLNPSRVTMPDIDLDFRDDRRAEMLEYAVRKFGEERVAQIITFGTLGARAAIRDVGRVMDIPLPEIDKLAKLVPFTPGKTVTIDQTISKVPEFKQHYESASYLRELIDTARSVEGVVRNAGTHAAGVIISDKPMVEYIPLHRPTGQSADASAVKIVTQFDMNVLESLGLLKVDFLGLATLTIMARACELIYQRHGVELNLRNIPTDDPQTYELLGRGDTAGVFQMEGSGMRRCLMQMKPHSLAHVIAMVALFRPGPMDSIPGYIRRMHGEEPVEYKHPLLEEVLKETYGFPIYQEQIMSAAMRLAGYTAAEADDLRKAIAKKIKKNLEQHRQKFIDGAVHNGIDKETAAELFVDWEEWARYGFNKSHAVDYGVIAVRTAYLKRHFPVEYMTALLSVWKTDNDKTALYVADCRKSGVQVEAPEINASDWDFSIEDCQGGSSVIRFGLGAVKNVGQAPVDAILQARKDGKFHDLNDFAHRVDLRLVGKRALESLIKVGVLDAFGSRLNLLEAVDRLIAVSSSHFRAIENGQLSLFGMHTGVTEEISLPPAKIEVSRREILNWERELIGLYISDHPLNPVMKDLEDVVTHYSGQLSEVGPDESVRLAGIITHFRRYVTKKGKTMGFVTIEDLQGSIELLIFAREWARLANLIEIDRIVLVDGHVDNQDAEPKVRVDNLTTQFTRVLSVDRNGATVEPPGRTNQSSVEASTSTYSNRSRSDRLSGPGYWMQSEEETSLGAALDWESMPPQPEYPPWEDESAALKEPTRPSLDVTLPDEPASRQVPQSDRPEPHDDLTQEGAAGSEVAPVKHRRKKEAMKTAPSGQMAETNPPAAALVESSPASRRVQPTIQEPALVSQEMSPDSTELERYEGPARENEEMASETPMLKAEEAANLENPGTLPEAQELAGEEAPFGAPKPEGEGETPESLEPESAGKLDEASEPEGEEMPELMPAYLVSSAPSEASEGVTRMLTVVLRSTKDKMRDVLRIRRIHGLAISYPGNDHFAVHVFEKGRGYLVEFPNFTCGVCDELVSRLGAMAGDENVKVETLQFR